MGFKEEEFGSDFKSGGVCKWVSGRGRLKTDFVEAKSKSKH